MPGAGVITGIHSEFPFGPLMTTPPQLSGGSCQAFLRLHPSVANMRIAIRINAWFLARLIAWSWHEEKDRPANVDRSVIGIESTCRIALAVPG